MQPIIHELNCPNPTGLCCKNTGTHKMVYYEWGKGDRIVLCLHGLTRNGRDFDYLAHNLAENGYRVLCPDIVGRGCSDWLEKTKWYGYPLYIADVMALVKHLDIGILDIIGTSMGGLMGMMLAASNPNLIRKMVINDIGPFIPKDALIRIANYVGQASSFANYDAAREYLFDYLQSFGVAGSEHFDHLMKHSFFIKDGTYYLAYDPRIGDVFRDKKGNLTKIPDIDLWKVWDKIKCPVIILRGGDSDVLPKNVADKMRTSRIVEKVIEFTGVGHAPMLMDDKQISVIRNWL